MRNSLFLPLGSLSVVIIIAEQLNDPQLVVLATISSMFIIFGEKIQIHDFYSQYENYSLNIQIICYVIYIQKCPLCSSYRHPAGISNLSIRPVLQTQRLHTHKSVVLALVKHINHIRRASK